MLAKNVLIKKMLVNNVIMSYYEKEIQTIISG